MCRFGIQDCAGRLRADFETIHAFYENMETLSCAKRRYGAQPDEKFTGNVNRFASCIARKDESVRGLGCHGKAKPTTAANEINL